MEFDQYPISQETLELMSLGITPRLQIQQQLLEYAAALNANSSTFTAEEALHFLESLPVTSRRDELASLRDELTKKGVQIVHRPQLAAEYIRSQVAHPLFAEALAYLRLKDTESFALKFDYASGIYQVTNSVADGVRKSRRAAEHEGIVAIENLVHDFPSDFSSHNLDQDSAAIADDYDEVTRLLKEDDSGLRAIDFTLAEVTANYRPLFTSLNPKGARYGRKFYGYLYPLTEGIVPDYLGKA